MSKSERQDRYEATWRKLHRPQRRFKRDPRSYWQPKPQSKPRWLRDMERRLAS